MPEDDLPPAEEEDEVRGPPVQQPQRRREGLLYRDDFAGLHFK